MRKLPIYFLVDVSESMVGDPIAQVEKGMQSVINELRCDPYALETVHISVIAFAGKAVTLCPLTEVTRFCPPIFHIGGGTSLGAGLRALMDSIDKEVRPTTKEAKGDWRPVVFFFTDGTPTDNYRSELKRWKDKYFKKCTSVAISVGDGADPAVLSEIASEVLRFNNSGEESYKKFFKWVSASIQSISQSVADAREQQTVGVREDEVLEKIDLEKHHNNSDDKFVVLLGRCCKKENDYLLKYVKDKGEHRSPQYQFEGGYPINRSQYAQLTEEGATLSRVNADALMGGCACPCCGNAYSFILCGRCGKLFCGNQGVVTCPWCGNRSELAPMEGGETLDRRQG